MGQLDVLSALKWTHSGTNDETTSPAAAYTGLTVCMTSHLPKKPCYQRSQENTMENYKRILMKGSFKPYVGKYNNNKPIKVDPSKYIYILYIYIYIYTHQSIYIYIYI